MGCGEVWLRDPHSSGLPFALPASVPGITPASAVPDTPSSDPLLGYSPGEQRPLLFLWKKKDLGVEDLTSLDAEFVLYLSVFFQSVFLNLHLLLLGASVYAVCVETNTRLGVPWWRSEDKV